MTSAPGIYLVPRDPRLISEARAGRPYAAVAQAAACSPSFLCELSTGVQRKVTAALAARIEDALGAARGALFTLEPDDAALLSYYG